MTTQGRGDLYVVGVLLVYKGCEHETLPQPTTDNSTQVYPPPISDDSTYQSSHKNYSHRVYSPYKKRGPKDGWHGITIKVLKLALRFSILTNKKVREYFKITRQTAHYHLRKLVQMRYLVIVQRNKHDPNTYYVTPDRIPGILLTLANRISFHLGNIMSMIIVRYLSYNPVKVGEIDRRYIRVLQDHKLVIRTGGQSCKYAYIIPNVGYPNYIEHKHKYTKRNHY